MASLVVLVLSAHLIVWFVKVTLRGNSVDYIPCHSLRLICLYITVMEKSEKSSFVLLGCF